MSEIDIATAEGVLAYLSNTPFAAVEATSLAGGFGNYTFRIRLREQYGSRNTLVLKHAKPYLPGSRHFPISLDRQLYEVGALRRMKEWLPEGSLVTVPEVHLFDEGANVIIMDDCGEHVVTLKELLQSAPPSGAPHFGHIGIALGEFLGRLHSRGKLDAEALQFFDGNAEARRLSAFVTYGRLVSNLTDHQLPALSTPPLEVPKATLDAISRIAAEVAQRMMTTRDTVVMGDFWPGNVLVALKGNTYGGAAEIERLYVVDWELAKPGLAGMDVGQFCAELHLMRVFHAGSASAASAVLQAFLESYRRESEVDVDTARTAIVHVGAHLVAWTPIVPWGSKEKTREVVWEGIGYLVDGYEASEDYIAQCLLGLLLP